MEKCNDFYWVRHIKVVHSGTGDSRSLTQYHSVGWPDMRVPSKKHYGELLSLLEHIVTENAVNEAPIVVHCSAGIGRTGTFLSLYFLLTLIKDEQASKFPLKASIFGTVRSIKEQRAGAVETPEQYMFIYKFISLYLNGSLRDETPANN